ncbi:hypothetical protein ENBRE01_1428 [Enteropsectra breve]|nr:hypothetical protein ENBRE01_1428 [Enteropsectra breve]
MSEGSGMKNFVLSTVKSLKNVLWSDKIARCITIGSITSTFFSRWCAVKAVGVLKNISKVNNEADFTSDLLEFAYFSAAGFAISGLPKTAFTWRLQRVSRIEYVNYLKKYLSADFMKFTRSSPSEIRYFITMKALSIPYICLCLLFELPKCFGSVFFGFIYSFTSMSAAAAVFLLIYPLFYVLSVVLFVVRRIPYHHKNLEEMKVGSSHLYDKLINYEVIKTYNLENTVSESYYEELKDQTEADLSFKNFEQTGAFCLRLIQYGPLAIFCVLQVYGLIGLTVAEGTAFIFLFTLLSTDIGTFGTTIITMMNWLYLIKFGDGLENSELDQRDGGHALDGFSTSIKIDHLSIFHGDTLIIGDINEEIMKGEKIAVVGQNGCGKSTFIKSLLGFAKTEGSVYIDGMDTSEMGVKNLHKLISYVPQEDYTADDTIFNNLLLGKKDASREYVYSKAEMLGAHETFMGLENGYDTQAGPRGNSLSGGQRQKLSLVRAAVKDAPIFIMDEATSATDKVYENELIDLLFDKFEDYTIIMIVHGKTHLKKFDRIFYFGNHQLLGSGSYEFLKNECPSFKEFLV